MPNDTFSTLAENLKDPKSLEIADQVRRVADLESNVLFFGETGTGKDFWAGYLQACSRFPKMLNLNCGDVPETLLESEWFGHRQGAFTGADRDYPGRWVTAENGIIFLNQIDLLGLNLQSKLLRIIERKKYFPLGANQETAIRARFLFSADGAIEDKVKRGEFRADLFYRISTYKIFVPPLRDRKKDVVSLLNFFCHRHRVKLQLDPSELARLLDYPWPGNIRELENFVNRAAIAGGLISGSEVAALFQSAGDFLAVQRSREVSLEEMERAYIDFLIRKYRNKSRVAEMLKISRKSLYNKLKKNEKS